MNHSPIKYKIKTCNINSNSKERRKKARKSVIYSTYKHVEWGRAGYGKRYQEVVTGMPHMSKGSHGQQAKVWRSHSWFTSSTSPLLQVLLLTCNITRNIPSNNRESEFQIQHPTQHDCFPMFENSWQNLQKQHPTNKSLTIFNVWQPNTCKKQTR